MTLPIRPTPNDSYSEPPNNAQAEQALLGAILLDNRKYDHVGDFLRGEHFYHLVHGEIFDTIAQAIEAGRRIDAVSLRHHFEQHGGLINVGGAGYLAALMNDAPYVANARDYGEVIHDCAMRRELIATCHQQAAKAMKPDSEATGQAILEETEARLQEIAEGRADGGPVANADSVPIVVQQIHERRAAGGGLVGLPTGFTDLDRLTSGLIAPQVIVLAARPSMGKTSLACNVAGRIAAAGHPVLIYSLEMAREEIQQRMIAERSGISAQRLQQASDLSDQEMTAIATAGDAVLRLPIYIDDSSNLTVPAMLTRARHIQRRHGLRLVIIDHIGYVRGAQRRDNRTLELGDIMKGLRNLAKTLRLPVIALCQLNRTSQQRDDKRPQLSDLRQSGEIEEDADQVWLLHRDYYYMKRAQPIRKPGQSEDEYKIIHAEWLEACSEIEHRADLIMGKNRNGPQDTTKLYFDEATMRFDNIQGDGHVR